MATLKRRGDVLLMVGVAVVLRLAFWAYTHRLWEDALTTATFARNAAAGLGLTHHPGEPAAHGFTSALSVLIPLASEAVSHGSSILALRGASLLATIVTIAAADALGRQLGIARWGRLLVMGYLAVDANHIFYGMSGMETQVAVAALLVSAWAITARHPASGIALGVALLARPDFLIWAAILVAVEALRTPPRLRPLLAGAAVVVAPWIVFTTAYYGSPIPQTIVAKSATFTTLPLDTSLGGWIGWVPEQLASRASPIVRTFAPFLEDTLSFATPVPVVLPILVAVAMFGLLGIGLLVRFRELAWMPIVVFVIAELVYRVTFLPHEYHDWYVPPFTAMAVLLVAAGAQWLAAAEPFNRERLRGRGQAIAATALVACFALPLPWVFGMERSIQVAINDDIRVPLALELGRLVEPDEPVVMEAPGFIGYFAPHLEVMDYPGLTSRTSFAAVQRLLRGRRTLEALVDALRPPWVVMRPVELGFFRANFPATADEYHEVWRVGTPIDSIGWQGYWKVTVDGEFIVLRRGS